MFKSHTDKFTAQEKLVNFMLQFPSITFFFLISTTFNKVRVQACQQMPPFRLHNSLSWHLFIRSGSVKDMHLNLSSRPNVRSNLGIQCFAHTSNFEYWIGVSNCPTKCHYIQFYCISADSSTCFGRYPYLSSGAHSNCNYNIWHWSNRICYRLLTWRSQKFWLLHVSGQ